MNLYTIKEKLLAIQLLGMAKQIVAQYANPCDREAGVEAVLTLAAEYARNGACLAVIEELEYRN